jgi:hypothetical protein
MESYQKQRHLLAPVTSDNHQSNLLTNRGGKQRDGPLETR